MGKQWKQYFIFLCSKITSDGDYNHEIKRCLLLGRKTITKLDSILKSRNITFPTMVSHSRHQYRDSFPHIHADTYYPSFFILAIQMRQHIKKQRHYFANRGPSSQGYGFSSGHVWMWELDYKESWAPKNWCFRTVVLEKTLESPLGCKEIEPVHPKGDQSWVLIGRTDVEAETAIVWPPTTKSGLILRYPDAGEDWRQEEKGMTEDEMGGWHHWLDEHEFE